MTIIKNGDIIVSKITEKDKAETGMNNTYGMDRQYINRSVRGYSMGGRREMTARRAPAWLVAVCRFILWLCSEEVRENIAAAAAICFVALIAVVAGAMSFGAVPLFRGVIICAALGILALFSTRDL